MFWSPIQLHLVCLVLSVSQIMHVLVAGTLDSRCGDQH